MTEAESTQSVERWASLARELATVAHELRDLVEAGGGSAELDELAGALALGPEEFADSYAQLVPLLSAFERLGAAGLARRCGPLRRLALHLDARPGPPALTRALAGLDELLAGATIDRLDPLADAGLDEAAIHLYEAFLHAYDPALRRRRGVYYTPTPAARFIVGAVDDLLSRELDSTGGLPGLADAGRWTDGPFAGQHRVQILDPACGTGTFLREVIRRVHARFCAAQDPGLDAELRRRAWVRYAREQLAPRLFGFEILAAPQLLCHLQLALTLVATGLRPEELPALAVHRTDALSDPQAVDAEDAALARAKREAAISVIVGNPPYSASVHEGAWIHDLCRRYAEGLNERKSDLRREEWKFLAYAQHRLEPVPVAALGLLINRSYLEGTSARVMREQLAASFPRRLIVDLHGDQRAPASTQSPGAAADENVFAIEQGVCATILARGPSTAAGLRYASITGSARAKLAWLGARSLAAAEAEAEAIEPLPPARRWIDEGDAEALAVYLRWPRVDAIFRRYSSGMQSKRDKLAVGFDRAELLARLRDFAGLEPERARAKYELPADGRDWSVARAQADLRALDDIDAHLIPILYRPFDLRWTCYTGVSKGLLGYPRRALMDHVVGRRNLGLICNRQVVSRELSHFGVSRLAICHGTFYLGNRGQDYLFPLRSYDDGDEPRLNLAPEFLAALSRAAQRSISGDEAFAYLVALVHAPGYRRRYAACLRADFPRIPASPRPELLAALIPLGERLIAAHTLDPSLRPCPALRFCDGGDRRVRKLPSRKRPLPRVDGRARLAINGSSHFEGLDDADWRFEVGGYQPAHKWLAARRRAGRSLAPEDIEHYRRLVAALRVIRATMAEIDDLVDRSGGWPEAFCGPASPISAAGELRA